MEDEKTGQASKGKEGNPPRKTAIFRIARALLHRYSAKNAQKKKEYTFHQENERTMANWSRRVGYFTAALFVASLISNLIIYGQLREMRSSSADTQKLVDAAQKSAKATQDAVEVAKDTAKRQLRAYLFHTQPKITIDGTRWTIEMKVRNVGQTPAQNASSDLGVFVENLAKMKRIKVLPYQEPMGAPIVFISRDIDYTMYAKLEISAATPESKQIWSDSSSVVFINVRTQYGDIFKSQHLVRTQFRCVRGTDEKWICDTGPEGNEAD